MNQVGIEEVSRLHEGESILVVAPGPSLERADTSAWKARYSVAIFIGDSHRRTNFRAEFNYYLRANTESPRFDNPSDVELLREFDALFVAVSMMESPISVQQLLRESLPDSHIYIFDQRHTSGENCSPTRPCCQFKLDATIQEIFSEEFDLGFNYSPGTSTVTHAIATAIMMRPRVLHIVGADLPLRIGEYIYDQGSKSPHMRLRPSLRSIFELHRIPLSSVIRHVRRQLAVIALGPLAPSAFAEGFVTLLTDMQMFSMLCKAKKIEFGVYGENSLLLRVHGTRKVA